jgi:hypothetical protein
MTRLTPSQSHSKLAWCPRQPVPNCSLTISLLYNANCSVYFISVGAGPPKKARVKKPARARWVYEPVVGAASPYWDTLAVTAAITTTISAADVSVRDPSIAPLVSGLCSLRLSCLEFVLSSWFTVDNVLGPPSKGTDKCTNLVCLPRRWFHTLSSVNKLATSEASNRRESRLGNWKSCFLRAFLIPNTLLLFFT